MKVMLAFPPVFDPTMPNLALPCLTAVLKTTGHEVIQKDLNIESFDILLSKQELERAFARVQDRYKSLIFFGVDPGELDRLIAKECFLINNIDHAKQVIRNSRDFYHYGRYLKSQRILEDGLKLLALAFYGSRLSFDAYHMFYSPFITKQVLQAVRAADFNLYHDFYSRYTIPEIIRAAPQALGISIATHNQVIPGLTLAYLVKQAHPEIHIVIGGSYFTFLRGQLAVNRELFSLFDSVIVHEGEAALPKLLDCLENGLSFNEVPNLIYHDGAAIIVNKIQQIDDLKSLPTPSFDGLPLYRYFSPITVLPVYSSRGCYWGKCAFCNLGNASGRKYSFRGATTVKEDMETLAREYQCNFFALVDEAIPPESLEQLADEILASGLNVKWGTHARLEPRFDRKLFEKLARSGCRILFFGLESACKRILDYINKGTDPAVIKEILSDGKAAGIVIHVSLFIGFPTETLNEAKNTMKFILDNIKRISGIIFGNFNLLLDSECYEHPADYRIEKVLPFNGYDLAIEYNYKVKDGLTGNESLKSAELFNQVLQKLGRMTVTDAHLITLANHYQTNDLLWLTAPKIDKIFGKKRFIANRLRKARRKAAVLFNDQSFLK